MIRVYLRLSHPLENRSSTHERKPERLFTGTKRFLHTHFNLHSPEQRRYQAKLAQHAKPLLYIQRSTISLLKVTKLFFQSCVNETFKTMPSYILFQINFLKTMLKRFPKQCWLLHDQSDQICLKRTYTTFFRTT